MEEREFIERLKGKLTKSDYVYTIEEFIKENKDRYYDDIELGINWSHYRVCGLTEESIERIDVVFGKCLRLLIQSDIIVMDIYLVKDRIIKGEYRLDLKIGIFNRHPQHFRMNDKGLEQIY